MPSYQEIVALEQKYLLNTYARYPVAFARGKGVYLFDVEGKRYLDFLSGLGVNALGHAHPRIVKVIREQAAKVIHLSNLYYNEYQGLLAEKLCKKSGLDRAFFTNSGTEAVEGALKLEINPALGTNLQQRQAEDQFRRQSTALMASGGDEIRFGLERLKGSDSYKRKFAPQ